MDKNIFDELPLDDDLKEKVRNAWEKNLEEAVALREAAIAKEMNARYERNKARMGDIVEKLVEARIAPHIEKLEESRRKYDEAAKTMREELEDIRKSNTAIVESHLRALDRKTDMIVESKLKDSIDRFGKLRKKVIRTMNESVARNREELDRYKADLNRKAAMVINNMVESVVNRECREFRDDILKASRNEFGMRLFEAFEETFVRVHSASAPSLKSAIEDKKKAERRAMLAESRAKKVAEEARKRIHEERKKASMLVESERRRARIAELVSDLTGDTKAHMKRILEEQEGSVDLLESVFHREMRKLGARKRARDRAEPSVMLTENRNGSEDNVLSTLKVLSGIGN